MYKVPLASGWVAFWFENRIFYTHKAYDKTKAPVRQDSCFAGSLFHFKGLAHFSRNQWASAGMAGGSSTGPGLDKGALISLFRGQGPAASHCNRPGISVRIISSITALNY